MLTRAPRGDSDMQLLNNYARFGKFADSNQAAFQISTNIKYDYPTCVRANFVTRKLFTSVKVSALSIGSVTKICLVYYFQIKVVMFEHEFGAQFRSLEQCQSVRSSITIEIMTDENVVFVPKSRRDTRRGIKY